MKTTHLILMSTLCITQATQAFNLPRQATKSYECDVCGKLSHENLQDKWGISGQSLNEKVSNLQKSYSYKQRVTSEQLRAGVTVSTLAPGAVVRITPLQNKAMPQLKLKTPAHQLLNLKDASTLYSEDEAFGNVTTKHQTMLQIKPELGSGRFVIKSNNANIINTDSYMISVFDKFSKTYMEVETNSLHYQYGDTLTATISLHDDDDYDIDEIYVSLVGPAGQNIPLKLKKLKNHKYQATATLLSEVNDHGENWYVEAEIISESGMNLVRRIGHTAFSYSVPSATLISVKKLSSKPLTFVATLEVATASRYALQSVLYRKNGIGEPKPIETSQKAQWLEAGKQVIQFTFDNSSQLTDDSLSIGYLRLTDYGQLKTVYQFNQPIKLTQLVE